MTSPAHPAGAITLTVTSPGGLSAPHINAYSYYPPVAITAISPRGGTTAGGTTVTLTGTGFTPGPALAAAFGDTPATAITCHSTTSCTLTSPAHLAGRTAISLTTPGGTTAPTTHADYMYATPTTATSQDPYNWLPLTVGGGALLLLLLAGAGLGLSKAAIAVKTRQYLRYGRRRRP